jgi:hypothetical protein
MTSIRLYRSGQDRAAVRACIVELQEHERALDPRMPEGEAMADECLEHLRRRCAECAGTILVADVDRHAVTATARPVGACHNAAV